MNLEQFRWMLFIVVIGATGLTLTKIWSSPPGLSAKGTIALAERVPLADWELVHSQALQLPQETVQPQRFSYAALGAQHYRYRHQTLSLDIELWLMDNTNGDVQRFASLHSTPAVRLKQVQKGTMGYIPGSGYYLRFVTENRTYWSSCISAKGENTVTVSQFTQKGLAQNLRVERLWPWLLENRSLFDRQCLWSNFSVASATLNTTNNPENKIIKTWTEWVKWWQNSRILKS